MGKLSLDNRFGQHPKFEGWSRADRWAWLEVMLYCARYDTGGRIPNDRTLLPHSCTKRLLIQAETAGWIDRDPQGNLTIHDFQIYNGPKADKAARQARWRGKQRDVPVDGLGDVLVDATVDGEASTGASTRARDRDRTIGPPQTPRKNRGGSRRDDEPPPRTPVDVYRTALAWLDSPAFDPETMSVETVTEELGVIERRMHVDLAASSRAELLKLARSKLEASAASWEGDEP